MSRDANQTVPNFTTTSSTVNQSNADISSQQTKFETLPTDKELEKKGQMDAKKESKKFTIGKTSDQNKFPETPINQYNQA